MEEYNEEKNMQQREIKLGIPSYITVESEEGSFIGEQNSSKFEKEDICVEANENGEIWLTADTAPVKTVKLRWNTPRKFLAESGRELMEMQNGRE